MLREWWERIFGWRPMVTQRQSLGEYDNRLDDVERKQRDIDARLHVLEKASDMRGFMDDNER